VIIQPIQCLSIFLFQEVCVVIIQLLQCLSIINHYVLGDVCHDQLTLSA